MLAMLPVMAMAAMATMPDPNALKLEMRDAHVTTAEAGASTSLSALLVNPTSSTLVLVGATSPLAGQTALQRYVRTAQGLIQIEPVGSLTIPPKGEVVLMEGALELQLVGLTQTLQVGTELPLTLKFADGTTRVVRVKVEGE